MAGPYADRHFENWNLTLGCTHVSDECTHCTAERIINRLATNPRTPKYHNGFDKVVTFDDALNEPATWTEPKEVWVSPLSDLFHPDVPDAFITKAFEVMASTPQHTYYILTKRPERMETLKKLPWEHHIIMGVSVGTQEATARIPLLKKCGARRTFVAFEPLLEEITKVDLKGISFVYVAGEQGGKGRKMEQAWVETIKKQCDRQKVPFRFKGWGNAAHNPDPSDPTLNKLHRYHTRGGCALNGKLHLDHPFDEAVKLPTVELFGREHLVMDAAYGLTTIWELKGYLPVMQKELMSQLQDDIRRNGMNDPVLFCRIGEVNLLLEGHTRLMVAMRLGLETVPMKEVAEPFASLDEVKLWMVQHQFRRRNLTTVEKIELAWLSRDTIEQMAKANLSKGGKEKGIEQTVDTHAEIARLAGVGRTTVVRYSIVVAKAPKALLDRLHNGTITISSAYNRLKSLSTNGEPAATNTPSAEPAPPPPYREITSHEEGLNLLNNNEIYGIITLPDNDFLTYFTEKQLQLFGVQILNPEKKV